LPKIAIDEDGKKKVHSIIGGKVSLVCYAKKPLFWQYRQLKQGSKLYIYRVLNEKDLNIAIQKAEKIYSIINNKDISRKKLISKLIDDWINIKEENYQLGKISLSTLTGVKSSLRSVMSVYLIEEKCIEIITDIKQDTFKDFIDWRINMHNKSRDNKYIKRSIKLSTINIDLCRFRDWFINYLIPNGHINFNPLPNSITFKNVQFSVNPPISIQSDWPIIYKFCLKYSRNASEIKMKPRLEYYRNMFLNFICVSYETGARPKELIGNIEKKTIKLNDGSFSIKEAIQGGLKWCDIKFDFHSHNQSRFENCNREVFLYINNTRTGLTRNIPININKTFLKWWDYCNRFRKKNSLADLSQNDFVFINPYTSIPYTYQKINKTWNLINKIISTRCKGTKLKSPYTLTSLSNSYTRNLILGGNDIQLINKYTGHSFEFIIYYLDKYKEK
tara:strand:- start:4272 stop:5606 length:1335 start_codon:yes stop_codon:yes gene_type:complete